MAYRPPTWDELHGKKKKKRFVGPTKAAASQGLATEKTGRPNVVEPVYAPGMKPRGAGERYIWESAVAARPELAPLSPADIEQANLPGTEPIPSAQPGALELGIQTPGVTIAQTILSQNENVAALTPEEVQVRNISIAYFRKTGKLPLPDQVYALMTNPATASLDAIGYERLLTGIEKMPEPFDTGLVHTGLFRQEYSSDQLTEAFRTQYGQPTKGPRPGYFDPANIKRENIAQRDLDRLTGIQTPLDKMKSDMQRVAHASVVGTPTMEQLYYAGDPNAEIMALSDTMATRLRNRGAPVEWDTEHPGQDPDFMSNTVVYALAEQFAYSAYGQPKEQKTANEIFTWARSLPYTNDAWNEVGKKLGVGVSDWRNQKTFGMVMDSIRSSDNDISRKVIYDSWLFGRPRGEAPSESRWRFVNHFGAARLPGKERMAYESSAETVNGLMETAMKGVSKGWKKVTDVPVLGAVAAPIGWAFNQSQKWVFAMPTQAIMSSLSTIYDMTYRIDPELADQNLSRAEYVERMQLGLEERKLHGPLNDTSHGFNFHWDMLASWSEWSSAWEENWGRNLFTDSAETLSVQEYGYIVPWMKDAGDLANFGAQMWMGAKLDPLARAGFKGAAKGAFYAGRWVEPKIVAGVYRMGQGGKSWWEAQGQQGIVSPGFRIKMDTLRTNDAGVKVVDISPSGADALDLATATSDSKQVGYLLQQLDAAEKAYGKDSDVTRAARANVDKALDSAEAKWGTRSSDPETMVAKAAGKSSITVDASVADPVARSNDAGYVTHQSHGFIEDHPIGTAARDVEPYIEYRVDQNSALKIDRIKSAAEFAGLKVEEGSADIGGGTMVKTVKVQGQDIGKFVDDLAPKRASEIDVSMMSPEDAAQVRDLEAQRASTENVLANQADREGRAKVSTEARKSSDPDSPSLSPADLLAHIKQAAADSGGLIREERFWDPKLGTTQNNEAFLKLAKAKPDGRMKGVKGTSLEMIADGLQRRGYSITSDDLWEIMQEEAQRLRAVKGKTKGKAATTSEANVGVAQVDALTAQIEAIRSRYAADQPYSASMFDTTEYLPEGVQGGLVDATGAPADLGFGQKTSPVAEARPKAPEQMPGQTGMEMPADEVALERELNREPTTAELDKMDADAASLNAHKAEMDEAMSRAEEVVGYKNSDTLDPQSRVILHREATRQLRIMREGAPTEAPASRAAGVSVPVPKDWGSSTRIEALGRKTAAESGKTVYLVEEGPGTGQRFTDQRSFREKVLLTIKPDGEVVRPVLEYPTGQDFIDFVMREYEALTPAEKADVDALAFEIRSTKRDIAPDNFLAGGTAESTRAAAMRGMYDMDGRYQRSVEGAKPTPDVSSIAPEKVLTPESTPEDVIAAMLPPEAGPEVASAYARVARDRTQVTTLDDATLEALHQHSDSVTRTLNSTGDVPLIRMSLQVGSDVTKEIKRRQSPPVLDAANTRLLQSLYDDGLQRTPEQWEQAVAALEELNTFSVEEQAQILERANRLKGTITPLSDAIDLHKALGPLPDSQLIPFEQPAVEPAPLNAIDAAVEDDLFGPRPASAPEVSARQADLDAFKAKLPQAQADQAAAAARLGRSVEPSAAPPQPVSAPPATAPTATTPAPQMPGNQGRVRTPEEVRASMGLGSTVPAEKPVPVTRVEPSISKPDIGKRVSVARRDAAGGGMRDRTGVVVDQRMTPEGKLEYKVQYDGSIVTEGQVLTPEGEIPIQGEWTVGGSDHLEFISNRSQPVSRPPRSKPNTPHKADPAYAEETARGVEAETWAKDMRKQVDAEPYREVPDLDSAEVVFKTVVKDAESRTIRDIGAQHGKEIDPATLRGLDSGEVAQRMQDAGYGVEYRNRLNNHMADVLEERASATREVTPPEPFVAPDDGTPFNNKRLEEAGYPIHEADDSSIVFRVGELGEEGSLPWRFRIASIRETAKNVGGEVVQYERVVDGEKHSFIEAQVPDPRAFTDELMKIPYNASRDRLGPEFPGGPDQPPMTPDAWEFVPPDGDPTPPIRNWWFRTNAEVLTKCDDPAYIRWMYQVSEENPAAKAITDRIAKSGDIREVSLLLRQLEEHGVEIDGGAAAFYKNMRQAAYRSGFGHTGFGRLFFTPTTYGKTHRIEGSTDMMYNVMTLSKLGKKKLTRADFARIRDLRNRLSDEPSPLKKRVIVKEIWKEMEDNVIAEYGSLEPLQKFTVKYHRMQGRQIIAASRRAYFGVMRTTYDEHGNPVTIAAEGSRVTSPGRAVDLATKQLNDAKADLKSIAKDAPEATKTRIARAVVDAELHLTTVAKAIDTIEDLGAKDILSQAEKKRLGKAQQVIDDYEVPVPMKMGQAAKHIIHDYNPRVFAAFVGGPESRFFHLYIDQMIAQPMMTLFKEMVMSALGFPIRVNIGDELVRLVPEGVFKRMSEARATEQSARKMGMWNADLDAGIMDEMAMDWVAQDSGDWVLVTKGTHPRYFEYMSQDLASWAREPIVQRLVQENHGVFPTDVGDIHAYIRRIATEDSPVGQQMRMFLEDTYRAPGGKIDEALFRDWTDMWEMRLGTISKWKVLRDSMVGRVGPGELKNLPDEALWPINAPESAVMGSKPSLNWINYASPFHYLYQGVRIPGLGGRRVGALQILSGISNQVRSWMFADRYYLERREMMSKNPEMAKTLEGLQEIHNQASDRALKYTNRVTYSRSSTAIEDLTRNFIPFGNAYRQFALYWGATFFKHPVSMSVWLKGYGQMQQNLASLASQGSEAVGGPDISLQGQFLGVGDYQAYLPSIPFLSVADEGKGTGLQGLVKSNVPMWGMMVTVPMKTAMGALGMDAEQYSSIPMFEGLGSMTPYSRLAKLTYGLTGWTGWGGNTTLEGLFGNPDDLEKAHANAVLAQLSYKEEAGQVIRNKPWWWRGMEDALGVVGLHDIKPEALFNEGWKSFVPTPAAASYSPKATREKGNWSFDYYDKIGKGDAKGAAAIRAEHPWLDKYLSYYDASPEDKVAMKRDPANTDMLKWWVSPYNYDKSGAPMDGYDWQTQFANGKVTRKSEEQYITSVNNLYVDIHGGTYLQSDTRQGGTTYKGDTDQAQAHRIVKQKITSALKWAQKISDYGAKTQGWDPAYMMFKFQNPDKDWGIWPQILKMNGKDPNEYDIALLGRMYATKYDITYASNKTTRVPTPSYKVSPQYLSGPDALRAFDLAKWMPDPKLANRWLRETPYADDIVRSKNESRTAILNAVINLGANDQWYYIGSQQLNTIGIPASPKLDLIQTSLHTDYANLKKLKAGSKEYKAARNAYYAKADSLLGGVKGGRVISGGLPDRLIAIPFVLTPNVTTMGTGPNAVSGQTSYENFMKVVRAELKKDSPQVEHIDKAWDALVGWRKYQPAQQEELGRVAAWGYALAEAKRLRRQLRSHHSDYYDAPGESTASKYGTARVAELNKTISALRTMSPKFGKQLDDWFGKTTNVGSRLLDWYNY